MINKSCTVNMKKQMIEKGKKIRQEMKNIKNIKK